MVDTDLLQITGSFGPDPEEAQHTPVEAENTLRSTSIYRVLDLISEGEIVGLVNGAKSVYINGVPLQDADGTYNFQGVTIEERTGTPSQVPVSGFPEGIPSFKAVNWALSKTQGGIDSLLGFYHTPISNEPNLDYVQVIVAVDGLYRREADLEHKGDINAETIELSYILKAADISGAETSGTVKISGKCMSQYQKSFNIKVPANTTDDYTLAIYRLTDDFDTINQDDVVYQHGKVTILGYTLLRDRKLEYPHSAYIYGMADSRLFGTTTPKRSYHVKGLKVMTPNGYTPPYKNELGQWVPAVYPEFWGSQLDKYQYSNNPAWCLYDLLTNERYGAGIPDDNNALKTSLYPIAKYCDELVSSGIGEGQEPRFTLNYVINSQSDAYSLINALVSVFRGMCWWGIGSVLVSQDAPNAGVSSLPQILVTPSNVLGGTFTYEGSALKARHSTVLVTWNDPDYNYSPCIEYVEDRESLFKYGYRSKDIVAVGCTSRGLAHRVGKWVLDSEKNETEIIKYGAGLDHAFITPGMIIEVVDPYYQSNYTDIGPNSREESTLNRMGGRIVAAGPTEIVLDSPVTLQSGISTYTISFMIGTSDNSYATPTIIEKNIDIVSTGVGVPVASIVISESLSPSDIPVKDAVWVISASNADRKLSSKLYRVVSIVESDGTYEVVGLEHDPTKYARVESNILLLPSDWDTKPSTALVAAPTNTAVTLLSRFINNKYQNVLVFAWQQSIDARVVDYKAEWRVSSSLNVVDGVWKGHVLDNIAFIELSSLSIGYYDFRVQAITSTGSTSEWAYASFALLPSTLPIVTNVQLANRVNDLEKSTIYTGKEIRITWEDNVTVDEGKAIVDYEYYIIVNDSTVGYHTKYLEFIYTYTMNSSDNSGTPVREVKFDIYKRKTNGVISDNFATITVNNPEPTMSSISPVVSGSFKGLSIEWSVWSTTDDDLYGFNIFLDTSLNPTTLVGFVPGHLKNTLISNLNPELTYRVRIVPVDDFGSGISSQISYGTPLSLTSVDVNVELTESWTITDSVDSSLSLMRNLYDKNSNTGLIYNITSDIQVWINYNNQLETYIDKVIVKVSDQYEAPKVFIKYTSDTTPNETTVWNYLGGAPGTHTLGPGGILYDITNPNYNSIVNDINSKDRYWQLTSGTNIGTFPARSIARNCRLVFVSTNGQVYDTFITELLFVREVIVEQLVAENLSTISAKIGTVYSDEYKPGESGFLIDGKGGLAEFNNIRMVFNNTNGSTWDDLVVGGPPSNAINTTNLVKKGFFDESTDTGLWTEGELVTVNGMAWKKALKISTRDSYESSGQWCIPGETLFMSAWMDSTYCNYEFCVGACFYDSVGAIISWSISSFINPGLSWTACSGSVTAPEGAVSWAPWLHISGYDNLGYGLISQISAQRHEIGATNGATWGVNIGGENLPQDNATCNVFRGVWDYNLTNYFLGDEVFYNGSTWGCVEAHTSSYGKEPPALPIEQNQWWAIRSKKGEDSLGYTVEIESTNGNIFRINQSKTTVLIAHVFKNGLEVTDTIPASNFRWRRVSYNGDTNADNIWNTWYSTGYKQIELTIDSVQNIATFHCDIITPD